MAKRQIVLTRGLDDEGFALSMGSVDEVVEALERFNTAPDGSARAGAATLILHGPGLVVEFPTALEDVRQALVTLIDEDTAWPVLTRLCKALRWTMVDPQSGRSFG
ncbi:MAG: hypothetical protein ACF8R7_02645 [Phycisphaerales bacterium JB039]